MRALGVCIAAAALAGCAQTGVLSASDDMPGLVPSRGITPQGARDAIAIGKSTKPEVSAAVGRAIVIPFDSGYEVWVYRWRGAEPTTRAATELVVLFSPAGVVDKTRIRPGYSANR